MIPIPAFLITPPRAPEVPLIAHVPHSSTLLTSEAYGAFKLSKSQVIEEIARMTDWHVDDLFSWIPNRGGTLFTATLSRLVFDAERFSDDAQEPMARHGQGVVYTKTSDGRILAEVSSEERRRRIEKFYAPYHAALDNLTVETLERFPTVTVLDCHSFSSQAIPAGNGDLPLPDICLGSDEFHTPPELLDMLESRFVERGFTVRRNFPFAGSMVPAKFLGCDRRVRSVMVEIRRGLYCDEDTGRKNSEFENLRGELESILVPLCAV